ncbi:Ig-like domain-containing protein [Aquimarina megaterium]|uniref:Ig-like domain-containing protein n=1 Tax=Aquimarina megaterium TaxID=1443666 RepID=UPI000472DC51|nr:Ig-like domain-containing protein [Aquimarina megaterium]
MEKNVFKCIMMMIMILPLNVIMPQDAPRPNSIVMPLKARDFTYHVQQNKMQYLDFSASSPQFSYGPLTKETAATYVREIPLRIGTGKDAETIGLSAFSDWVVSKLPNNGKLYYEETLITSPGSIPSSRGLIYIPNLGFTGEDTVMYHAVETTGNPTSTGTITFKVNSPENYVMPPGFPETPQWGLFLPTPEEPTEWPDREAPNAWYIDNNCNPCATSGKGTPNLPRATLPPHRTVFPAGTYIKIIPSETPYYLTNAGQHIYTFNGTAANPIFMVGVDNDPKQPTISTLESRISTTLLAMDANNLVISGLRFWNVKVGGARDASNNNVVVRHCQVAYSAQSNGSALSPQGRRISTNISIFSCSVRDNGFRSPDFSEIDVHGMGFSSCTDCMLLDIISSGNGGDSYQHLQNNINGMVRIGRLKAHGDGENSVDIKAQNGIVVSECVGWDYRAIRWSGGSGGNGQLFFTNDDDIDQQKGDVLFYNNRGWDTNGSAIECSAGNGKHYLIGNRIEDVAGTAFNLENSSSSQVYVAFNTTSNVFDAIHTRPHGGGTKTYIFANAHNEAKVNGWLLNRRDYTTYDYNFYSEDQDDIIFSCCSNSNRRFYEGLATWQEVSGKDANAVAGVKMDLNDDLSLGSESELIDTVDEALINQIAPGFFDFINLFDLGEWRDANRVNRISPFDAGATEFGSVGPVNSRPIARDDTAPVDENSTSNSIDVLINDTYRRDGASTDNPIVIVTAPDNGTATVDNRGTNTQGDDRVMYTPNAGYTGVDSLVYRIEDGNGDTSTATVNITVGIIVATPVANDDNVTVDQDSNNNVINVLANDENFDPAIGTITIATSPTNGTATVNTTDDTIAYTPNAGVNGTDSFTYTLTDANNATSSATVTVTITSTDTTPPTVLENGVPITGISGPDEAKFYYTLEVPAGATDLVFNLTTPVGGSGNADLYIGFEKAPTFTDNICKSESNSRPTNERCEIVDPVQPGTYFVFVNPFKEAINNLTLTASYTVLNPSVPVLQNGVPVTDITAKKGEERRYTLEVPAGATDLSFKLIKGNGTGDSDLYVNLGAPATFTDRICVSIGNTSNEECLIPDPVQPGVYHVLVNASNDIAGITLVGSYTEPSSTAGASVANIMISPIPANNHINVKLSNAKSGTLNVYDLFGNILSKKTFTKTSNVRVNVSDLPQGNLYMLTIQTEDGYLSTTKFVK